MKARLLRHVFVHVAPAVFLHDVIEHPQRDVVVSRIGGDDLALELRFQEIRRRVRDVGGCDLLGVVHVGHHVHHGGPEGAVGVLECRIHLVETVGLECQQPAFGFPAPEVAGGLEYHRIDLELAGGKLRVDLLVEHVGEAAADRDLDAGKALLEHLGAGFPRRGRAADIERECAFALGFGIKIVERLSASGRCRGEAGEQRKAGGGGEPASDGGSHDGPPQVVLTELFWAGSSLWAAGKTSNSRWAAAVASRQATGRHANAAAAWSTPALSTRENVQ